MNRVVSLCLLLVPALFVGEALAADKHALLVGVTVYKHSRMNEQSLRYPEDDAQAVARLLKESGYEVTLLLGKEATRTAIEAAMQAIAKEGAADGVLLLGFFGHGIQYGSDAYYCPFDASVRDVKDADGKIMRDKGGTVMLEPDPATLVSMQAMLDTLTRSGAGNKVLLADCCREDPSRARGLRSRAFGSSLRVDQLPKNCAALFACSEGERAFEHDEWQHGAFTKALLDECIVTDDVTANLLSVNLYRRVNTLLAAKSKLDKDKQSVNNVMQGVVDLKLTRSTPKEFVNSIGMRLLLIPAGSFLMGSADSDSDAVDDEKPQHPVTLTRSYYMGETEVTQGQWKTVMGTEPWKGKSFVREGEDYPATNVSWNDAVAYCRRLSEKEGREYRLPTEAEWEYACRGSKSARYSFGDNTAVLSRYGWFEENADWKGEEYAHLVKQRLANPFGLYDMHGNVWEWCSDRYAEKYTAGSTTDPVGPSDGGRRVYRGGSWNFSVWHSRSARRNWLSPTIQLNNLGFRIVSVSQ